MKCSESVISVYMGWFKVRQESESVMSTNIHGEDVESRSVM